MGIVDAVQARWERVPTMEDFVPSLVRAGNTAETRERSPLKPIVYISDLDGTLLDPAGTLPPNSRDALAAMLREGLTFTVASARSGASIQTLLQGVPLSLPVIEFNGAFISDLATGRHEIVNALERDAAEDVYRLTGEFGGTAIVSTFDGKEDRVYYARVGNLGTQWFLDDCHARQDTRWHHADDMTAALREQVVCLTIIDKQERLAELEAAIVARWAGATELHLFENMYSPGWHWLTVHDRRATKDQAIKILREAYGLQDHALTVFGDQTNDLKMFRVADCAVAVANADPRVQAQAHQVIGPNTGGSVVQYIQSQWTPKALTAQGSRA